jgi:hypothetical protein
MLRALIPTTSILAKQWGFPVHLYFGNRREFQDILCRSNGPAWWSGGCRPSPSLGPIQKARDRFPGAGSILAMLNICR